MSLEHGPTGRPTTAYLPRPIHGRAQLAATVVHLIDSGRNWRISMKTTAHACRIRYVFADGCEIADDAVGAPDLLANAAYDRGAVGVTVMVLA
ncbi:hypothetical protein PMI40_03358 [Herbaspirillum sp. YR522]|nr:hypothetical protein PMI40_03358 [Herbaspirillum sp. YR522]